MAFLYAGETIEITSSIVDFDQTTKITPTQLGDGTVTLELVDSNLDVVLTEPMSWDSEQSLWVYLWDTTSTVSNLLSPYQGKVTVVGSDSSVSFDYLKISLKAPTF